jgi:hypothetical protein
MVHNFFEDDFVHQLMTFDGLLLGDTDELLLQRYGTITVVEVEETRLQVYSKERSDILKRAVSENSTLKLLLIKNLPIRLLRHLWTITHSQNYNGKTKLPDSWAE